MDLNAYDVLKERGFIEQCTHDEELRNLLGNEKITFYIGYDPTADSLTVGHYLTLMALSHMQRAGHTPIVLMGGGTGMVGDPTDKTEMRRVMTRAEVAHNVACQKKQFERFISFGDGGAVMVDNADWLLKLNYVDFIRNYGVHFNVNRMLSAEAYKARLKQGLTFYEMNYMLMQSFDFLTLYRDYGCRLQVGGDDQWSNMIAGMELIRKCEGASSYVLTFTLLTTSDGVKMGKTAGNAVWLDASRTSPYEFFQHWRNSDDGTVIRNLKLLTYLPLGEIDELSKLEGSGLNRAKETLAYEVTKTVHGEAEAKMALDTSRNIFSGGAGGSGDDSIPQTTIAKSELDGGMNIIVLLEKAGLIESRGDGRRLVAQGGITLNGVKVGSIDLNVAPDDFKDGSLVIQKGKKVFHKVVLA